MPANITADTYAQLKHFSDSGDMRSAAVVSLIREVFTSAMTKAGLAAILATSGDTVFTGLHGTTLVLKKSIDGGSTFPVTRTHTWASDVKAFKAFATVASGHWDSVVEAKTAGPTGNGITIVLVGDSPGAGGVTIGRVGNAFTIHYESGVSTVGDVETAIGALAGGDALIDVKTTGTGATVLTAPADNDPITNLAGGTLTPVTIDDVIAELGADSTFMGGGTPDIVLSKSGVELIITSVALGTNIVLKADASSTGFGANKLHYTNDQLGTGGLRLDIQIIDQMGHKLAGVKQIIVRALAVAGTAVLTDGGAGSINTGSGTAEVWGTTDSTGLIQLGFVDVTAEDIFIKVQTDNGEIELNKITTPLP